ncbi:MAG: putative toxin-antitoxin system toxin component, PIN family [Gemmatimonadota bacterium]
MRVCLDTNVLIAAFATRGLCSDVLRTVLTEHELVLGDVIITELRRNLKSKLRLPENQVAAIEAVFSAIDLVPKPAEVMDTPIRDRADRWILATAVAGDADVLVTGDDDLLSAAASAPIPIVSPRAFWELLRTGANG